MKFKRSDFPDGFKFGAATSAYQIEGSRFGGCGPSHWDSFCATPGNSAGARGGGIACDHYHHFESDLDLVSGANLDIYRFSISWPRVLPEGKGKINMEGLDFYDRLVDGILERGIEPHATLYHWDLPSALTDLGGWQNRSISDWLADYAQLIGNHLGDRLASIATINEPWCVAWLSHFLGHHAPGLRDIRAAGRAMHHVLLAHGKAVERLRGAGMTNIGIVLNFEYAAPAKNNGSARKAAHLYDGIYNRWFIEGIFNQSYPQDVLAGLGPYLPKNHEDDFGTIGQPIDWLGVNYYTRSLIEPDPQSPFPSLKTAEGDLPKTDMDWEIYPEGLYHFLTWVADKYSGDLPLFVTENGMASSDRKEGGTICDSKREAFIDEHIKAVKRAVDKGVPVQGYMVWSLLDNFEWAYGYDKRFGLVYVDYETLERTPKQSWHALSRSLSL